MRLFIYAGILVLLFLALMAIVGQAFAGERHRITNDRRQVIGDIYCPNLDRRCQVRDNNRRIRFYIERDGTVTDSRRRKVGEVEDLDDTLRK